MARVDRPAKAHEEMGDSPRNLPATNPRSSPVVTLASRSAPPLRRMYGVARTSMVAPRHTKNTARIGSGPLKRAPVNDPKYWPTPGQIVTRIEAVKSGTSIKPPGTRSIVRLMGTFVDEWRERENTVDPSALVFSTRSGKAISPNNVLRRAIFPAGEAVKLPRATWLTFRPTYSSWSHDKGVPGKVIAQLMGHANVDTTLNVYTQVIDGALGTAVEKIGDRIVHDCSRIGRG
jgi:hypothetical protein